MLFFFVFGMRILAGDCDADNLVCFCQARDYAEARGIIIADTKFEFGLDPETQDIVLIDEVLTPDSSRFWPKDKYEVGKSQSSYDKASVALQILASDVC